MIDLFSDETVRKLREMSTKAKWSSKDSCLVMKKPGIWVTVTKMKTDGISISVSVNSGSHVERIKRDSPETVTDLYSFIHGAVGDTASKLSELASMCSEASAGHDKTLDLDPQDYIGINL